MYNEDDDLKLIVLSSFSETGKKVNEELNKLRGTTCDYRVNIRESRFNNGEAKMEIIDSIRHKDVYILGDVGNHSITYKMYDYTNHMSPDDHFLDIKRVIYAVRDHAKEVSVIMPLLYESRQHRRKSRESLDCAAALQDLVTLKTKNIITFDVHDIDIQNAIPVSSFESFYPTKEILQKFIETEQIDFNNMFVVSPDAGAISRNNLYANLFNCDLGFFRKERDTSVIIDGKNPITKHIYVGQSVKDKNVIVADDMIASGGSMIDVASSLKELGASKIYLLSTFGLFTKGVDEFNKAYEKGLFDKIYVTNLTYFDKEYYNLPWLEVVDCSLKLASVINSLNVGNSLSPLLNDTDQIHKKILERKN
ncbi:MAG: ribose-phosphate diphosphokinase [Bacilli bacterium]